MVKINLFHHKIFQAREEKWFSFSNPALNKQIFTMLDWLFLGGRKDLGIKNSGIIKDYKSYEKFWPVWQVQAVHGTVPEVQHSESSYSTNCIGSVAEGKDDQIPRKHTKPALAALTF